MIDAKKLGPALLAELQRRSTQKNADRETLLESLDDGSGAHLFVGENDGNVSLLVPIEDGFDGPKRVQLAVPGQEAVVLDDVKKDGTVVIEGKKFARFILEPLRWGAELNAASKDGARPVVALRGEGPDGLWSPLGFDDWFHADFATLKWLATSSDGALVVAPEVTPDARDPSWKPIAGKQRESLEKILGRPLPAVVHDSVLASALDRAKSQGNSVIHGALEGLGLVIDKPKVGRPTNAAQQKKLDKLERELKDKGDVEKLRHTQLAMQGEAKESAKALAESSRTTDKLVAGQGRFVRAAQNAELDALKREQLVVDLTPGTWATQPGHATDACIDAVLFLADLRATGSAKTLGGLQRKLAKVAERDPLNAKEQETLIARYAFPDGSKVVVALDDDESLRSFVMGKDGRKVDIDFTKMDLFRLPGLLDPGPAAAQVDEALLFGKDAHKDLAALGFQPLSDRLFKHADGSWVAMVPGKPPRVAAGIGDRSFDLKTPSATRGNPFDQLPTWVQKMVRLSPPGENVDLQLMARQLAALDEGMLAKLRDSGYTLDVTRYRMSNAQTELRDLTVNSGGSGQFLADLAEGMHVSGGDKDPSIIIRTYFVDGQLRIDMSTLLHEIGHAFDLVVSQQSQTQRAAVPAWQSRMQAAVPATGKLHEQKDVKDAFDKEHKMLPQYFHTEKEFVAETFALYMLDAKRCKRQFPLAFAAYDKRFADIRPDSAKLLDIERGFDRPAVVTPAAGAGGNGDLRNTLAFNAQRNQVLRESGVPTRPMVVHLEGRPEWGTKEYVADAARHVRNSFGNEAGTYRNGEAFVAVGAGTWNSADEMEKLLGEIETSGRAAVLYVDAHQVGAGSAGFDAIERWIAKGRDVPPLVLAGDASRLKQLEASLPSVMTMNAKVEPLNAAQQVERVKRLAAQDGFLLAAGVTDFLEKKLKGGGYDGAAEAWQAIKTAQFERQFNEANSGAETTSLTTIREITLADVGAMKMSAKKSPQERLAEMVGQDAAKRQIDSITKQAKVSAMRAVQGIPDPSPPRLNLLFSGAPGTGKTTFADILGGLLQEVGTIKNPVVTKVTIQDLVSGSPEAAVKALFEQNNGGVIFLDEMHQLKDTTEGKRAFRAMIPYLADPAYADTVFIGAGYDDELGELVRDVDAGAERRFTKVPFLDYARPELAQILDMKARSQNFVLDNEAREAALAFLDHRKRITKNFGNAGEIDIAIGHAQKAQTLRIADLPADKINKRVLMEIKAEDFAVPTPITKEAFWKDMDAMSGWDDVKARLREMAASIEGAVKRGKAPTDAVEPYWIVDGPPGTGKTTLAAMLAKFGAAYGLTALPDVHPVQGANFQGEFVGQTAGVVQKQFEKAWGRLMFVDEVSGLAKSGGDFKFEAAKIILAQTENHRGKFMMVVADYAHNINQFLGLDPGLARRFGNRITLQPWAPAQSTDDLVKKLASDGVHVTSAAAKKAIDKGMTELVDVPGYASGGDVRSLKVAIVAALDAQPDADIEKVLPKAIATAFTSLIDKKHKDAAGTTQRADD